MLIAMYLLIMYVVLPPCGAYMHALINEVMPIAITIMGIIMVFGIFGMHISSNLAATFVGGIFKLCIPVVKGVCKAVAWVANQIRTLVIHVFKASRNILRKQGMTELTSDILAVIMTIVLLIVVI